MKRACTELGKNQNLEAMIDYTTNNLASTRLHKNSGLVLLAAIQGAVTTLGVSARSCLSAAGVGGCGQELFDDFDA